MSTHIHWHVCWICMFLAQKQSPLNASLTGHSLIPVTVPMGHFTLTPSSIHFRNTGSTMSWVLCYILYSPREQESWFLKKNFKNICVCACVSWPLNNMGLNCVDPLICRFFLVAKLKFYMIHSCWITNVKSQIYGGLTISYKQIFIWGGMVPLTLTLFKGQLYFEGNVIRD